MAAQLVNLDALIPREDFEVAIPDLAAQPSSLGTTLKITELGRESLTYNVLRKPDFQRETANWTPEKIADLIANFLEGDLIPAIILWRSPVSGTLFVIDGAHRLSALAAWVHDDYGDKHASVAFFDQNIPVEQSRAAEATRILVNNSVGSYSELSATLRNPTNVSRDKLRLARNLGALALDLQWVHGEASKAEASFFRINQQATPIDDTELDMIKARRKPNALAARAIVRAGTGHRYWSAFDDDTQLQIETLAREVYSLMFKPSLESTAVRSADLPAAGRGYSSDSVRMVFGLVNFVNRIQPDMGWYGDTESGKQGRKPSEAASIDDDIDGSATIKFIRAVRRTAGRIAGNEPGSLGLHPAVYFYGATGRFQPSAFLATVAFLQRLEDFNGIAQFTKVREQFEEFLVDHKHFTNQIVQRYGAMQRAVRPIAVMHDEIYRSLRDGRDTAEIMQNLLGQSSLKTVLREQTEEDRQRGGNFSAAKKNRIVLDDILASCTRCAICGARLPYGSISVDHIVRKVDGGGNARTNGQLTHPYCNTGYKEQLASKGSS